MKIKHSVPSLSSLKISDINHLLPTNVYVQSLQISYLRTHERDKEMDIPINTFKVKQCSDVIYIPQQTIEFTTPLFSNMNKPILWTDFIDDINQFYEIAYQYDPNAEKRTYVGDIVLLEIPADYIGDNKWDHTPLNDNDELYNGIWCKYGYFLRTYKILGADLGDMLSGCTKPADLSLIQMVKTKRTNGNLIKNHGCIHCYQDEEKNKYDIDEDEILKSTSPDWIQATFPSLYGSGILNIRQCEGNWDIDKKFRAEACNRIGANL